ncbi:MAG: HipA domain-containing protein [Cytophagales bacterium]|jgi:serine/threonine-protein kinase HipA|nr:HipA domain-containing protein [Cytophagales bacterium]MCA6388967.1 HipA domain-containing protein [Cytophagales bacterium]MCA6391384.1 HipA domain-containing protein [Cytophagales bacterium]MCA6395346.1 HipA domain-containing protein [Cytophagales bacterium]MCA6400142.1 HipA domain-containing protein [Cytophagales bacterium]
MNRCPITYELCGEQKYSAQGLKLLSPKLKDLLDFPYNKGDQLKEAMAGATKMSIQGVQPKLSARLNVSAGIFEIADQGGNFIIKPQNDLYEELPENEDLTMRLAALAGIEIPLHGMIYSKDGSRSYFIKRFDRLPKKKRVAVEDFAQLTGQTRETKYSSSMEKVAGVLDQFCTFPLIEKQKLFRLTIFNFLCGNEDMHLKNFSLIRRNGKVEISPSYDLLNTTIAMSNPQEEFALTLAGRKSKITKENLIDYFGSERLGLTPIVIEKTLQEIENQKLKWYKQIQISFLSEEMKKKYVELMSLRWARIFTTIKK